MMKEFWGFLLLSDLPNDALSGINFTVFGFGDSVYPKFNAMARKLHQRLIQLGANLFYNRGLGRYFFFFS
jgi:sulfite reductase alpha subunit-like flavoprotein